MADSTTPPRAFAAGDFGATIVLKLLSTLSVRDFNEATSLLDSIVDHPLIRQGFRSAATTALPDELGSYPAEAEPRFIYHRILLALQALDRLDVPHHPRIEALLIRHAYLAGDVKAAKRHAEEALSNNSAQATPELTILCHNILGRACSDGGDFSTAARHFAASAKAAREAKLDYEEWDQRTNRIYCLAQMGEQIKALREIDAAEKVARRLQLKSPGALSKTLIDRGNAELSLGNAAKARDAYEGALAAAEEAGDRARQSDSLGNLGNIAQAEGDLALAEQLHRRALDISRTLSDQSSAQMDLHNLSVVLWRQRRSEEALRCLEEAVEIAELREDNTSLPQYLKSLREMREALGTYAPQTREERSEQPPSANVEPPAKPKPDYSVEKRVREFLAQGKRDDARNFLEQHLQTLPLDGTAICLYGAVLVACNDDEGAQAQFERAIELDPDSIDAHYRLIDLLTKMGRLDAALPQYEAAAADDPFRAAIRVALALMYERRERLDDAIQQALEGVRLAPEHELALRVLAETQLTKAHSLLESNWDGGWSVFRDCLGTMDRLARLDSDQKGQWLSFAARSLEEFAMHSHEANMPLLGGMDTSEICLLAHAIRYYDAAEKADPLRKTEGLRERVGQNIQVLAHPEQMALAAGHLHTDGFLEQALLLLLMALQRNPESAEAYHQLAHVMFDMGGKGSRLAALDNIERAIEIQPRNPGYREAKRHFERAPEPPPWRRG